MPAPTPPDFVERQFIGERNGAQALFRQLRERMDGRGVTWLRATILPEKDQIVLEGWLVRPNDDGPVVLEGWLVRPNDDGPEPT